MKMRQFHRSVFGSVAVSALLFSGAGYAQEADEADVVEVVSETPSSEGEARQEKIVVTGSLIARDEFASASPIQVITAEVATLEGLVDTAALLQSSSLAAGSTQLNNTFQNFVTNGGVGAQTVDLRGCGDTRTLVLVDGKRPGPSGTRGAIAALDLNVVPQSIIQRVEILKDGASTIYGSDAVCGVVNIITRDTVDKLELNARISQPFESGGEQYSVSGAWGFELGDFADFTFSAEYRMDEELDISQRDYLNCPRDYVRDPVTGKLIDRLNHSATSPDINDPNATCYNLYFNTVIDAFSGQRLVPTPDGISAPTAYGVYIPGYRPRVGTGVLPDGSRYYEDITDAAFLGNRDFFPSNENLSLFATSAVELGGISWDSEVLYSNRKTDVEGWRQFFPIIGSAQNAAGNNPAYSYIDDPGYVNSVGGLAQLVAPFPTQSSIDIDYYYVSSSLSGGFAPGMLDDWSWKLDGSYSRGEGTYSGNLIRTSLSGDWNYDGVADTDGDGVPNTVGPPTIDFFDPGILDGSKVADLVAAIGDYHTGKTIYEQTTFTAVVAGELFELPAGPLGIGLGAEYREFSIDDQPSEFSRNGDVWGSTTAGPTVGSNSVTEVFAEFSVPLLKGKPFAEDVELSASIRGFDYDVGGSDSIYKAGLNWQINPILRARSSYGTSYRAPALFELFLKDQTGFLGQTSIDPCIDWGSSTNDTLRTNCASLGIPATYSGAGNSSATVITNGGGTDLKPETGDTFTVGLILTPTGADLNIALDYYEIEINDQITSLGGRQIVASCYAGSSYPNDYCDLFERNPTTFKIDNIMAPTVNIDSQAQRGLDLEVRYQKEFNFGTMTVDGSVNWSLERYINVFGSGFNAGISNNDFNGTIGFPSIVGDASIRLDRGDWTYTWFTDFVGRQDDNRYYAADYNEPQNYFGLPGLYTTSTEAVWYHGASVRWQGDSWTFAAGVNNIFDEAPPQVSDIVTTSAGNTPLNGTAYDVRGRRGFVSVSKSF
ncbi:TonB-dependent receptor [Hyphomonas sp. WL0036]|uniref:TonB-dependent receptor domain-containing protein n=1 Tax=Hyphomonas sediminis TaxID=2866160 RepID=UPI001C81B206|nr:TonB-dependent receptor [Hyphomonas sediminis]MBY9067330.1 TonB-dependent receptor [Hyphomonas sediminis]